MMGVVQMVRQNVRHRVESEYVHLYEAAEALEEELEGLAADDPRRVALHEQIEQANNAILAVTHAEHLKAMHNQLDITRDLEICQVLMQYRKDNSWLNHPEAAEYAPSDNHPYTSEASRQEAIDKGFREFIAYLLDLDPDREVGQFLYLYERLMLQILELDPELTDLPTIRRIKALIPVWQQFDAEPQPNRKVRPQHVAAADRVRKEVEQEWEDERNTEPMSDEELEARAQQKLYDKASVAPSAEALREELHGAKDAPLAVMSATVSTVQEDSEIRYRVVYDGLTEQELAAHKAHNQSTTRFIQEAKRWTVVNQTRTRPNRAAQTQAWIKQLSAISVAHDREASYQRGRIEKTPEDAERIYLTGAEDVGVELEPFEDDYQPSAPDARRRFHKLSRNEQQAWRDTILDTSAHVLKWIDNPRTRRTIHTLVRQVCVQLYEEEGVPFEAVEAWAEWFPQGHRFGRKARYDWFYFTTERAANLFMQEFMAFYGQWRERCSGKGTDQALAELPGLRVINVA